ncbi:Na+/H+ antiporter [Muricoccus radiodurans]|uniref:Na+/H+ antiporter n=1 Tax=Muricoccus radiodurans TaxID=2231721 RepID=UPI003CEFD9D3
MLILEIMLALMAACIAFAVLAQRSHIPYAVVLVLGGMVLAFIPGVPRVRLDPELALAFFLPPLLQASAWRTDWHQFRFNIRAILLLAVGCVVFTALCVAVMMKLVLPELPWAAAIALGAVVAPPDAVAAASVLARLPIPRRLVTVLEGESLVNDASSLVLFRLAVGALAVGSVSPWLAALSFLGVALGGLAIGWVVARLAILVLPRLSDTLLEVAVSFLMAYAAFLAAEAVHVSGVIAVVTVGIIVGRRQHEVLSARTRVEALATWRFIEFVLTSLVFILVGLQLNGILERLSAYSLPFLIGTAVALSVTLIVSRIIWVFPATYIPRLIPAIARRDPPPPPSQVIVVAWAGMRGVVSLAVALALPLDVPDRDLLIFLAFCAILATLVVQGTTLEWVIRRLRVQNPPRRGMHKDEAAARRVMAAAELSSLEAQLETETYGGIARDLIAEYRDRHRIWRTVSRGGPQAELRARLQLRLAAVRAARAGLMDHHGTENLPEEMLAALVSETDHEELRLVQQLEQTG